MADLAKLVVRLEAQTAQYQKKLEKAQKKTGSFGKSVKKAVSGINVAFSAIAVGAFTAKIISATAKQEAAVKQLQQGLATTAGAVGFSLDQLTSQAEQLQKATTFGDEDIIKAQSQLVTFTKITGDEFQRTIGLAADLSTRFDTDLKSSVLQLGKALNDPVKNLSALSRAGIQFSDDQADVIKALFETGREAEAQQLILKELETQFGGSAKAAGETFGGALKGLQNDLGDLLEAKGGLPDATNRIVQLREVVSSPEFVTAFNSLTSGIISAFSGVIEFVPKVINSLKSLGVNLAFSVESAIAAGNAIKEAVTLGDGIGFEEAKAKFQERMDLLQEIRRQSLSEINTPAVPVEQGQVGAVGGTAPAANDGAIALAVEKETALQEAVKEVKEQFRLEEAEGKLERDEIAFEDAQLKLEGELATFAGHQQSLTDILAQQTVARLGLEKKATAAQQNILSQSYAKGLALLQTSGNKGEKIQKALRVKEAISATYSAAVNSYNALSGIPIIGPVLGAAAAVAATAFGLKQVSAIKSGGGGGGSGPSIPSSSSVSAPAGGIGADTASISEQEPRVVNLNIDNNIDPSGTRRIMEALNDQLGDGFELNVEVA